MRCLTRMLMLSCAGLSLGSCVHTKPPVDSFCQIYNQVVVAKGEGSIVATSAVKKRILANELTYRSQCNPALRK
jgi:hypothetical protein